MQNAKQVGEQNKPAFLTASSCVSVPCLLSGLRCVLFTMIDGTLLSRLSLFDDSERLGHCFGSLP